MKRIGAVLVFAEGVSSSLAQAAVDKLVREELLDVRNSTQVQSFDPEEGMPVWYIP